MSCLALYAESCRTCGFARPFMEYPDMNFDASSDRLAAGDIDACLLALSRMMRPQAVAVIGASDDATRIGGRPIQYLREAGFAGPVYPVNPKRDFVQGYPCYPSIAATPTAADVAILALPASQVVEVATACAAHGVGSVIIFSADFAETGPAGKARQDVLRALALKTGMRILGPNCLGAFNAELGFYGTFTQTFDQGLPSAGPVGVVSQSGAFGGHLAYLCKQRGIGVRYWITSGNECDIELSECLLWMVRASDVKVILVYAETVRHGARFLQALREARELRKPIIMLKVGRSNAGTRAAATHTGALAGQDTIYDAVLNQFGVYRADTTLQMLDVAEACLHDRFPNGKRIGILSMSGGIGIQMADAAEALGLDVARLPEAGQADIHELIPYAGTLNPIDLTASVVNDSSYVRRCVEITLDAGGYDALVFFFGSGAASVSLREVMLSSLAQIRLRYPDHLIALCINGPDAVVDEYRRLGYLIYDDVDRGLVTLAALMRLGRAFAAPPRWSGLPPMRRMANVPRDEHEAKRWLTRQGIACLSERLVETPEQVAQAAEAMGFPVVVKVVSPDIPHKTEVGGVVVNLNTPAAAVEAAAMMASRVRSQCPDARVSGYLVAPMCKGVEVICGGIHDPVFGPIVMVGLGGIHAELFRDVVFRLAPIDPAEAKVMLQELVARRIFDGLRGEEPRDVGALAELLSRLSMVAAEYRGDLAEIDLNPVVVRAVGEGAFALDALLVPHATPRAPAMAPEETKQ